MYKLVPTGIEYATHGWSFYPGCLHKPQGICPLPNCWAEGMSKRQLQDFHNPHLIPERLFAPLARKKPARILVNFMGDLGGSWVDPEMQIQLPTNSQSTWVDIVSLNYIVFQVIEHCPQHTFIFLTKNPAAWLKWGKFPDNCWVGATCWDNASFHRAIWELSKVEAKVKWLSIEPLYSKIAAESMDFTMYDINWVVIGAQTKPDKFPEIEWVREIVEAADRAGVKVFLKDNLKPLFKANHRWDIDLSWAAKEWVQCEHPILRQELPCQK